MFRPSRPLTIALLWLAIVLLPLRAWAASSMPIAVTAEAAAAMTVGEYGAVEPAGPCHQGSDDADVGSNHSCGLCGVCHSAVVSLPSLAPALPALPSARPPIAPAPGVERAVRGGPDRPPRIVLA